MATTKIDNPNLFDFSSLNTALQLPTGDTASRPSSPSTGEWRYNNELKYVEYWDGGAWRQIDTEALPNPDDFPSQNFNVNTYFGTGATQTIDAKFNEAANFNGSSSQIEASGLTGTVLPTNGNWSVSFWMKPQATTTSAVVSLMTSGGTGWAVFTEANVVQVAINGSTPAASTGGFTTAALNTWMHVTLTFNSSTTVTSIYYNGGSSGADATINSGPSAATAATLKMGYSVWNYFQGQIDQVRLFNTTLSDSQVTDLYTNETTTTAATLNFPAGAGCIAAYQLDGDASDLSGNYNGATTDIGFTGLQFRPDFTWIKNRDSSAWHNLSDSVRGASKSLFSNDAYQEVDDTGGTRAKSFNSNGFTLDGNNNDVNGSNNKYVAWSWKAGGAPTADNVAGVGNVPTSGSVKVDDADSTAALTGTIVAKKISANTNSAFSIVQYDGTGTAGTIDHLLGVVPNLVIVKRTDSSGNWIVGSTEVDSNSWTKILQLDLSDAEASYTGFNDTPPTTSVFSLGTNNPVNNGSGNYIAYCFANKNGYQRVGSYTGNNSTNGEFVYTTSDGTATGTDGFEPAFLMIKSLASGGWHMYDNKRNTQNPRDNTLEANGDFAQSISTSRNFDFYSNGFQPKTTNSEFNGSGVTYIYLAIGANPAPTPTLANSFKAVAYTGDGVNGRSVNDVGFLPQFTWIKNLDANESHVLIDQLRYPTNIINSNEAITQYDNTSSSYQSFIGNGFTIGNDGQVNSSSVDYISYNWKGASIPTINNAGTITSVTSVNDAAGFSAVVYEGTGANATVGHGLQTAPQLILFKAAGASVNWVTYNVHSTATKYMSLNLAFGDYSSAIEFQDTDPTGGASGVITLGSSGNPNNATYPMVAYCFHDISDYQKIGTYTASGTGDFDVNIGFSPSFLLIKKTSADSSSWSISDSARSTGTLPYFVYKNLYANSNSQQGVASPPSTNAYVQYRTNGFGWTAAMIAAGTNPNYWESGQTYIYLAIK